MTDTDKTRRNDDSGIVLTPRQLRSRRNRNIAIGLAIALSCILFYVVTIAKLGLTTHAVH